MKEGLKWSLYMETPTVLWPGMGPIAVLVVQDIMVKLKMDHIPLERIFSVFDTNANGDVDYREFLIGVSKFKLQGETAIRCKCVQHREC